MSDTRVRGVKYRREADWDSYVWRVYVDDCKVGTFLTEWGARRAARKYLAGKETSWERDDRLSGWRYV